MDITHILKQIEMQTANCCGNKDISYYKTGMNTPVIECANCNARSCARDQNIDNMIASWNSRYGVKELECQELLSR